MINVGLVFVQSKELEPRRPSGLYRYWVKPSVLKKKMRINHCSHSLYFWYVSCFIIYIILMLSPGCPPANQLACTTSCPCAVWSRLGWETPLHRFSVVKRIRSSVSLTLSNPRATCITRGVRSSEVANQKTRWLQSWWAVSAAELIYADNISE